MRHASSFAIGLAILALLGSFPGTHPSVCRAETYSGEPGHAKARHYRRPLEVTVYGRRRIGGYSYGRSDTINTYGSSPPPYEHVRQTPGGPFDSGFFFDSGIGLHGGNSPYQH